MQLTIQTEGGDARPGSGTFTAIDDTARFGKAAAFLLGGLAGAAVFIVVPVLHLITTWALPLVGVVACAATLGTKSTLTDITGSCPGCGADISLKGGKAVFPFRDACPDCSRPLLLKPQEA